MRASRLPRRRHSFVLGRFMVRFLFLQDGIGGVSQVTAYGGHRFSIPMRHIDPAVKSQHVAITEPVLLQHDGVSRLGVCLLEVAVHVRPHPAVISFAAARIHSGYLAGITGQLLRRVETVNLTHFQGNYDRQHRTDAGHAVQDLHVTVLLDYLEDAFLGLRNRIFDLVKRLQLRLNGMAGLRRQFIHGFGEQPAPFAAKDIAGFINRDATLVQCRMNTVLELGADTDQSHPRSRQFTLVPQFSRWNPHFRQRAIACQCGQASGIQFVRFIDLPIMSFALAACTSVGEWPALSISFTNQYQFPVVSSAI
jgi:hypothetical protein